MSRRIKQRNPADCAVCCVAMFLDLRYTELLTRFPYLVEKIASIQDGGLNLYEEQLCIMAATGKGVINMRVHYDWDDKRKAELFKIIKDKKAILSCRSLNVPDGFHAVYWDGKKVLDPSNKKRYTKTTIRPYNIMF